MGVSAAYAVVAAFTAVQVDKQGRETKQAIVNENDHQQKKMAGIEKQIADENKNYQITAERDSTRARQIASNQSGGRSSTILTSPLGIQGESTGTKKTLLGE